MPLEVNPAFRQLQEQAERVKKKLEAVKHKVAVVSGKGGVGKTTVAVYVAALLAREARVGLLDADIDCSNVGKMLGVRAKFATAGRSIMPVEAHGMKLASMDFLPQEEGMPIIWRGAIIHKAILQLIEMVEWGTLDYMIFDMPPGTSDAALTVMQNVAPDFFIVVTAPSAVATGDAEKAANMAKQFGRRFGIVENMSGSFFGEGGGERLAQRMNAPFLGRVALRKQLCEACDKGRLALEGEAEEEFSAIVAALKEQLGE